PFAPGLYLLLSLTVMKPAFKEPGAGSEASQIRSLAGLGTFTELEELIVDNNLLGNDLLLPREHCVLQKRVEELAVTELHTGRVFEPQGPLALLEHLADVTPSLKYLSLLGNEACPNQLVSPDKDEDDYQRYRYFVLHKLPQLKFLDTRKVTIKEVMEAQARGAFMKVVKPKSEAIKDDGRLSGRGCVTKCDMAADWSDSS
ncbi:Leucine-rich melanocyte differentiation-associated protein, partial [Dissostichus eleginoides]